MEIGAIIPNTGDLPREPGLPTLGQLAEEAGAVSLWVNDHLLTVEHSTARYPYTPNGRPDFPMELAHFECLVCCAYLAASTMSCRIGTAAMVLAQRNVLELAKATATLDCLSGGRFVLGVGVGWLAEEMEALGYSFKTRGRRANEMIDALRACWTGRPEPFMGEEVTIGNGLIFEPRPVTQPGPPILVGGMSDVALRRAVQRGDGWLAVANAKHLELDALTRGMETVRRVAVQMERTKPLRTVLKLHSPPELANQLPGLALSVRALGFDELIIEPPWESPSDGQRAIADVIAAVEDQEPQSGRPEAAHTAQH